MTAIVNLIKKYSGEAALSLFAALAPIKAVLISVGILILVDLVFGIWAAKKRGEQITSAAFRRTATKFAVYQTVIITGFILQKYLLEDLVPVVNIVSGVLGMIEMKSILENSNGILGQDIFKAIMQKLGSSNDEKKD